MITFQLIIKLCLDLFATFTKKLLMSADWNFSNGNDYFLIKKHFLFCIAKIVL